MSRGLRARSLKALNVVFSMLLVASFIPTPAYATVSSGGTDVAAGGAAQAPVSSWDGTAVEADDASDDGLEPMAAGDIASGTCGTCSWRVTSAGELIISPTSGTSGTLADIKYDSSTSSTDAPWYDNRTSITSATIKPGVSAGSSAALFSGCSKLASVNLSGLDTSSTTDMSYMFDGCLSLPSATFPNSFGSAATNMEGMFCDCQSLTSLDLSGFGTSSVADMVIMFKDCTSLKSVTLPPSSGSVATNMSSMFYGCSSLTSVEIQPSSQYAATFMGDMFSGCSALTSMNLSWIDTSNATGMQGMFSNCSALKSVTFSTSSESAVTNMEGMFFECWSLESLDLSGFGITNVTSMHDMFYGCSNLATVTLPPSSGSATTDMSEMFRRCSSLTSLVIPSLSRYTATKMDFMFSDCSSLTSLDLSSFYTSHVANMRHMFYGCSSLASLDISSFDTLKVTDMSSMFDGCSSLRRLSVGNGFSLKGATTSDLTEFPPPSGSVAGKWVSTKDLGSYTCDQIASDRSCMADTYTAGPGFSFSETPDQTWTGSAITPTPVVSYNGSVLTLGTDYTLSYRSNTDVGTAYIIATGMGAYDGIAVSTFRICYDFSDGATVAPIPDQPYTGSAIRPVPTVSVGGTVLVSGTDFTVTYADTAGTTAVEAPTTLGTYTAVVHGAGNFTGTKSAKFNIVKADASSFDIGAIPDQVYTGSALSPVPTVTYNGTALSAGTDFTVTYEDGTGKTVESPTDVGTYTVVIHGTGNFTGEARAEFKIAYDASGFSVGAIPDQSYTGSAVTPVPAVTYNGTALSAGTDFTVTYADAAGTTAVETPINAGTYTAVVHGAGNFTGTRSVTFKIVPADASGFDVAAIPDQPYTGSVVTPFPAVTYNGTALSAGTDFTVTYEDGTGRAVEAPTALGAYNAVVHGAGNFTGTRSVQFNIVQADASGFDMGTIPDQLWTGSAIRPVPAVTYNGTALSAGTDFTVTYADANGTTVVDAPTDAGTYTAVVHGIGNFTGTKSVQFRIIKAIASGKCGGCTWLITTEGELVISPTDGVSGTLADITSSDVPWSASRDGIKTATIEPGVSAGSSAALFYGCSSLESIDLSGLDTSKATDMRDMFSGCSALETAKLGGGFDWNGSGSSALTTLPDGQWKSTTTGKTYSPSQIASFRNRAADTYIRKDCTRLGGSSRLATMGLIVDAGFAEGSTCDAVILTTAWNYADALSASGLAGKLGCPIVTTDNESLSAEARAEITRLGPSKVYILGGTAAVSSQVEADLASAVPGVSIERLAGSSRIDTGAKIYEAGASAGTEPWSKTCIVTKGFNYADALAIAPYAYSSRSPVFLADGDGTISDEVVAEIEAGGFTQVIVTGGEGGSGAILDSEVASRLPGLTELRFAGANRMDTSAKIAQWATGNMPAAAFQPYGYAKLSYDGMAVSNAWNYPDALASVGLLGPSRSVLMLVDDSEVTRSIIQSQVGANASQIYHTYILGGTAAVSSTVEEWLTAAY